MPRISGGLAFQRPGRGRPFPREVPAFIAILAPVAKAWQEVRMERGRTPSTPMVDPYHLPIFSRLLLHLAGLPKRKLSAAELPL